MTLTGKEQSGKYTDLIKLFISTMNNEYYKEITDGL